MDFHSKERRLRTLRTSAIIIVGSVALMRPRYQSFDISSLSDFYNRVRSTKRKKREIREPY